MDALELLLRARARRTALGLPSADTDCYRLLHGAGDGLEGLTVDVYGAWAVASLYTDERGPREEAWLDAAHALGLRGVYLKHRPRQANVLSETELRARAPERAVRGEDAPEAFHVRESGMVFEVRLGDGLSTGLFLDQRDNRCKLRELARDKRVLNLFAYTCAFGVAAALGGARSTTNIDVARQVLERGKHNYALNGLSLDAHQFYARDVLETLPKLARRGERFDIVVLDPPSYASTKSGRFNVERDYRRLVALALGVLAPGGVLLACTNHQRLREQDLAQAIRRAGAETGRTPELLEFVPPPADHPAPAGRPPHLKSAWCRF
jgi:23S rRNA (cytosine1962-C5)-methyltransferase